MPSRILRLWNANTSAWEEVGDSRLTAHLAAADPHGQYLLETLADAKGDLLAASAADTLGRLAVGTDGQVLTANAASALGLTWATPAAGGGGLATDPLADVKGDLFAASANNAIGRLALGTDGQVLTADSTQALGLRWAAGGAGLPLTGGTMTGTITSDGAAARSTGALVVVGAGATASDSRVYGATSPSYTANALLTAGREYGVSFSSSTAVYLVAVRWYRLNAGASPPTTVRLWDSTSTASPVATVTALSAFADSAVGWKEQRLPAGTQPLLVAGRTYVLSHTAVGSTANGASPYTPVPDAPVTWNANVSNTTGGAYPTTTSAVGYATDLAVRASLSLPDPAESGALRLPNGNQGAVAWRNGTDGGDLLLTVDAADRLTFNGVPLAAGMDQATADLRYLQLAGGTLTGALVEQGATATTNVHQAKLAADTQPRFRLDASGKLEWGPGGTTAPDTSLARAAAGSLTWANTGILDTSGGNPRVHSPATDLVLNGAAGAVIPNADNVNVLGRPTPRWVAVYAVNGTIQTSLAEAKEGVTPLDPAAALEAVRNTTPVTFDYKAPVRGPEWYDLPDDPEQAHAVLLQRMKAAPLEEGARHQRGFVLQDETGRFPCDPMFETGHGQSNPANTAGILLAAIKQLDARLSALEAP